MPDEVRQIDAEDAPAVVEGMRQYASRVAHGDLYQPRPAMLLLEATARLAKRATPSVTLTKIAEGSGVNTTAWRAAGWFAGHWLGIEPPEIVQAWQRPARASTIERALDDADDDCAATATEIVAMYRQLERLEAVRRLLHARGDL